MPSASAVYQFQELDKQQGSPRHFLGLDELDRESHHFSRLLLTHKSRAYGQGCIIFLQPETFDVRVPRDAMCSLWATSA